MEPSVVKMFANPEDKFKLLGDELPVEPLAVQRVEMKIQGTGLSASVASFTIESSPDISRPSVFPDTEQDVA